MNIKQFLFVGILFFGTLILNVSSVFAVIYTFDFNGDGVPEYDTTDLALPIYWRLGFQSYGAENGVSLPNLSITGAQSFSVSIPAIKYTGSNSVYHAGWGPAIDVGGYWVYRCVPTSCAGTKSSYGNCYYVFEHYPSTKVYSSLKVLSPGTYYLNASSYGNAFSPARIEPAADWTTWSGADCSDNPVYVDSVHYFNEYYEYLDSVCAPEVSGTKCADCSDAVTGCAEYDSDDGYFCNGINIDIELVDSLGYPVKTIPMEDSWANLGQLSYVDATEGLTYITDSSPGFVDFTKKIIITQGCTDPNECADNICKEPVCSELHVCEESFIVLGENDEACVSPSVCDGAGNCVQCNVPDDCGTTGLISEFQCNENNIEQKYRTYSCESNTCDYEDSWIDTGSCGSNFCYEPIASASEGGCCTDKCAVGAECGFVCGQSCGTSSGICPVGQTCDGSSCIGTGIAYWANLAGEKIGDDSSVSHSEIGDSVLLIYNGRAEQVGNFDFSIFEDDGILPDDNIRIIPADKTFNYKGHLATKWVINSSDFNKGGESEAKFYFNINGNYSNNLNVNNTSTTPNFLPRVIITSPAVNSKTRIENKIYFNQSAMDIDDDLKMQWIFEDGENSSWMENCLTTNNCNTSYVYDKSSGTKIVGVIAREMTRTNEAVNYSKVFVYDEEINVFANITEPPFGKIFTNAGTSAQEVNFNASTSYAAYCSLNEDECGVYDDYYSSTDDCFSLVDNNGENPLYCYDFPNLKNLKARQKYGLSFTWNFSEGVGKYGDWVDDYDEVVEFDRLFYSPTQHWARLNVIYSEI
jgi:hypothetical protein